jgi:hypothetical protein
MTLSLVLEHPDLGVLAPPTISGRLSIDITRYPRMGLTATIRPDPGGVALWQTPYGTRANVVTRTGSLMFSGPVFGASVQRPDGAWTLDAADDILLLRNWKFSERPLHFLPGSTMDLPAFIRLIAAQAGVEVRVTGSGGLVDVRGLDVAGKDGWGLVEEQLIANDLDVWVQGDSTLQVGPTATMEPVADRSVRVGEIGTITGYGVDLARRYNRIVITHQADKQGEDPKYIDGVWEDNTSPAGRPGTGPVVFTKTVRVGADWWDNPAAHQQQADANAAAAAQTLRGIAREASVEAVPDYDLRVGETLDITFMSGVRDRFLCTAAEWPLEPGPMRITGRNPEPGFPAQGPSTFLKEAHHARSN